MNLARTRLRSRCILRTVRRKQIRERKQLETLWVCSEQSRSRYTLLTVNISASAERAVENVATDAVARE